MSFAFTVRSFGARRTQIAPSTTLDWPEPTIEDPRKPVSSSRVCALVSQPHSPTTAAILMVSPGRNPPNCSNGMATSMKSAFPSEYVLVTRRFVNVEYDCGERLNCWSRTPPTAVKPASSRNTPWPKECRSWTDKVSRLGIRVFVPEQAGNRRREIGERQVLKEIQPIHAFGAASNPVSQTDQICDSALPRRFDEKKHRAVGGKHGLFKADEQVRGVIVYINAA